MQLYDYLNLNKENIAQFAKRAKIPQPSLWRLVRGKVKKPNTENALKIERATNGLVSRMELLYPNKTEEGASQCTSLNKYF